MAMRYKVELIVHDDTKRAFSFVTDWPCGEEFDIPTTTDAIESAKEEAEREGLSVERVESVVMSDHQVLY